MKKIVELLIFTAFVFLTSCKKNTSFKGKEITIKKESALTLVDDDVYINSVKIISSPGHSFVPLYLTNDNCSTDAAAEFAGLILKVVSKFEQENDNLKVTSWRIEHGFHCEVSGIWFDHDMRYPITDSMNHKPQNH